jgi:tetratricopeptide (TPR) repeat protein
VSATKFSQLCQSLEMQIVHGHHLGLEPSIRSALDLVGSRGNAIQLAKLCQRIELHDLHSQHMDLRAALPGLLGMLARVAYSAGLVDWCHDLCQQRPGSLLAFEAWVCLMTEHHQQALVLANRVLGAEALATKLESGDADVAWRVRARAMAQLKLEDWRAEFVLALTRLNGRARGLCLVEFGYFLTLENDQAAARSAYAEAFGLLKSDPHFAALTQLNLGIACLHLRDLTAALRAVMLARAQALLDPNNTYLSAAWSGLGAVYRARHEFPRALHAYTLALQKAVSAADRVDAGRGMAHTQRILNNLDAALSALYEASRFVNGQTQVVWVDLAAAKLQNNDLSGAQTGMQNLPGLSGEDEQRLWVLQAERLRRNAEDTAAKERLLLVDQTRLWFEEEATCFPELFGLIGVQARLEPMRVRVSADGPIRAWINGLSLDLNPKSLAASLLCLLVQEPAGLSFADALVSLEVPGATPAHRAKNLERAIGELRALLEWPASVQRVNRMLQLDSSPLVQWLPLERPGDDRREAFCNGRLDPWVLEWRDRLSA